MQTDTEFTWMLLAFVALMAFMSGGPISNNPLVWAGGMLFQIPYALETTLAKTFPLLAPVFILAFFFYFGMLRTSMGVGMQMFIIAAFLVLVLGT